MCFTWTNLARSSAPATPSPREEKGDALPRAARPAEEPGLKPYLPRELDERGDVEAVRLGPDGDEGAAGGEVRLAVREERRVDQADGLEEDVVLGRRRVRREGLVQGRLGVVKELARASYAISSCRDEKREGRTSSAPSPRTYASFFADALAATRQPAALASWMANAPTALLPPFTKTLCSGWRPATSKSAW